MGDKQQGGTAPRCYPAGSDLNLSAVLPATGNPGSLCIDSTAEGGRLNHRELYGVFMYSCSGSMNPVTLLGPHQPQQSKAAGMIE